LMAQNARAGAKPYLESLAAAKPNDFPTQYQYALVLEQLNDLPGACRIMQTAQSLTTEKTNPTNVEILVDLGRLFLKSGKNEGYDYLRDYVKKNGINTANVKQFLQDNNQKP